MGSLNQPGGLVFATEIGTRSTPPTSATARSSPCSSAPGCEAFAFTIFRKISRTNALMPPKTKSP